MQRHAELAEVSGSVLKVRCGGELMDADPELGLILLMASIGLNTGGGIIEGLLNMGLPMLGSALILVTLPLAVGYQMGRKVLRMNPVLLLVSLTGALTSTPAIVSVNEAAKSSIPAIGYANTYTFANVFLTFAGTNVIMLRTIL